MAALIMTQEFVRSVPSRYIDNPWVSMVCFMQGYVPGLCVDSAAPSSIDPVLFVQPDHCSSNLAVQNTWKYCLINYHNIIHVSVS